MDVILDEYLEKLPSTLGLADFARLTRLTRRRLDTQISDGEVTAWHDRGRWVIPLTENRAFIRGLRLHLETLPSAAARMPNPDTPVRVNLPPSTRPLLRRLQDTTQSTRSQILVQALERYATTTLR